MAKRTAIELKRSAESWFSSLKPKGIEVTDRKGNSPLELVVTLESRPKEPEKGIDFTITFPRNEHFAKTDVNFHGDYKTGKPKGIYSSKLTAIYKAIAGFQQSHYPKITFRTGLIGPSHTKRTSKQYHHLPTLRKTGFGLTGEYWTGEKRDYFPKTSTLKALIAHEMKNSGIRGNLSIKENSPSCAYNIGMPHGSIYQKATHVRISRRTRPNLSFYILGQRTQQRVNIDIINPKIQNWTWRFWRESADMLLETLTYIAKELPARRVTGTPIRTEKQYENLLSINDYDIRGIIRAPMTRR